MLRTFAFLHLTVLRVYPRATTQLIGTVLGARAPWPPAPKRFVQKMQTHPFARRVPVTYTKGYFKQSLTDALIEKLKAFPPSIVTIDVDYYTSTLESLRWLDRFIASGALIYFDDMWAFHGHPDTVRFARCGTLMRTMLMAF